MSDVFKYNTKTWNYLSKQIMAAVAMPGTLAVFTAIYAEAADGSLSIVAHGEGHAKALRDAANALYQAYGDGACSPVGSSDVAEPAPLPFPAASLH